MRMRFQFGLFILLVVLVFVVACESAPKRRAEPTRTPATVNVAPIAANAAPTVAQSASATPTAPEDDGDCMAGCHIPDPNEEFANGAAPQPADHKEYKTCVECHVKITKPVYPATHVGRMDPACPLCHTLEAKVK
ncbi:MAG: hypothetical protein HY868_04695 [Chloroflexi bacterium]|nr:hypothetical protein [Chloroflexota bacterium]